MSRLLRLVCAVFPGIAILAVAIGCAPENPPATQPPPDPTDNPPVVLRTASISGRITVQSSANGVTLFEQEPNNSIEQNQFVATVSPGDSFIIFGTLNTSDPMDAFQFTATSRLHVSFALRYENSGTSAANDFDIGYSDLVYRNCYPGGTGLAVFSQCFATMQNPETGSMDVEGSFVIAAVPYKGRGEYQLEVSFATPGPGSATVDSSVANPIRATAIPDGAENAPMVPDEVVVRFAPGLDDAARTKLLAAHNLELIEASPSGFCRTRNVAATKEIALAQRKMSTVNRARQLVAQPGILSASPNYIRQVARTPNDEYYNLQWNYSMMNLPDAWDITTGSDDIIVAVVDTGILAGHPDIQGQLTAGYDFIADSASARDGDGRDANPNDEGDWMGGAGVNSYHGSHIAGIVGARTDNNRGVAGVVWTTRIMPLRALGVGGGTDFDVGEAVRYAAGLPNITGLLPTQAARVINLSVTGGAGNPPSNTIQSAIEDAAAANALIVAAAGNDGSMLPSYPAAFSEVIGVGAVDLSYRRAWYSNYGSWISVVAPGGNLGADVNGDGWADGTLSLSASSLTASLTYQYRFENGTSMAAPHVTGLAALILAINPNFTASDIRDIIQSTTNDLGQAGRDNEYGYGLIDASAALREAQRRTGGEAAVTPRMTLSGRSLDFGSTLTELPVAVSNTGGGILTITNVAVQTIDGSGWLRAAVKSGTSTTNVSQILVTVNRENLADGTYRGILTVEAQSVPPQTIDVRMTVGALQTISDEIYVLAVDPSTYRTVKLDSTSSNDDFNYRIKELPPGVYTIYAGTDRDGDGIVCEVGDLCGALPSTIAPTVLSLSAGEAYEHADFAIALQIIQQGHMAPASAIPLNRLP